MSQRIDSYCRITDGEIALNGQPIFEEKGSGADSFFRAAYKFLDVGHAKFYKMDKLSQLAFLAAETLIRDKDLDGSDVAILLANRAASLDTDRRHQSSIQDPENCYPSPAVFVYTLPNICIGEICIKHKFLSESSFFVADRFDPGFMVTYGHILLEEGRAEQLLCGWVDFDDTKYEAFLYLTHQNGPHVHDVQEVTTLYKK